jgi:hypothetical protein
MPGYRALAESFSGSVADRVREAAVLEKEGDLVAALRCYEEALAEHLTYQSEMPAFLCGRLATLYRRLGLNDQEVALLEQYRDSQTSDEARSRFQARLSKAMVVAEKKRRRESGALASVRAIREAGSGRSRRAARLKNATPSAAADVSRGDPGTQLVRALRFAGGGEASPALTAAVAQFCTSVKIVGGMEDLVAALKAAVADNPRPDEISPAEWKERCSLALQLCVAVYFGESAGG